MDRAQFIENLQYLKLSETTVQAATVAFDRHKKYYHNLVAKAYDGDIKTFPIRNARPLDRIVIWGILLSEVKQRYLAHGIPEAVIKDTFDDFALLAGIYEKENGKPGLTQGDVSWFRHTYHCHIIKLGSLQYQLHWMAYPASWEVMDPALRDAIPAGTPVISIHIQAGADMSDSAISDSLALAKKWIPKYFPEHDAKYFACSSWLLYPGMRDLLPENSKILSFASRFRLVAGVQNAFASGAVSIIYGKRYQRKKDYPQNTSLQKKALDSFSKLGIAFGIIEIS